MAQKRETTLPAQRLIRLLRQAISAKGGASLAGLTYYLPVTPRDGGVPTTYTVHLVPNERRTFQVACRELPDLLSFGSTEEEALAMAEVVIREVLADMRNSNKYLT